MSCGQRLVLCQVWQHQDIFDDVQELLHVARPVEQEYEVGIATASVVVVGGKVFFVVVVTGRVIIGIVDSGKSTGLSEEDGTVTGIIDVTCASGGTVTGITAGTVNVAGVAAGITPTLDIPRIAGICCASGIKGVVGFAKGVVGSTKGVVGFAKGVVGITTPATNFVSGGIVYAMKEVLGAAVVAAVVALLVEVVSHPSRRFSQQYPGGWTGHMVWSHFWQHQAIFALVQAVLHISICRLQSYTIVPGRGGNVPDESAGRTGSVVVDVKVVPGSSREEGTGITEVLTAAPAGRSPAPSEARMPGMICEATASSALG